MRKVKIFSLLLFGVMTLGISGCYEWNMLPKYANPVRVGLVNSTNEKIDIIDIGNSRDEDSQGVLVYELSPGGAVDISLPITNELMITKSGMCREMIHSYTLPLEEMDRLRSQCQVMFTYSKEELLEVSKPLLAQEYKTCVLLNPDGSLKAMTEHSTPWADDAAIARTYCANPKAENTLRYDLDTKTYFKIR